MFGSAVQERAMAVAQKVQELQLPVDRNTLAQDHDGMTQGR